MLTAILIFLVLVETVVILRDIHRDESTIKRLTEQSNFFERAYYRKQDELEAKTLKNQILQEEMSKIGDCVRMAKRYNTSVDEFYA